MIELKIILVNNLISWIGLNEITKGLENLSVIKWIEFDLSRNLIENVIFENGKTFSPLLDGQILFELITNRNSEFNVKIFN